MKIAPVATNKQKKAPPMGSGEFRTSEPIRLGYECICVLRSDLTEKKHMFLSVVIPVFNEFEALPALLPALRRALADVNQAFEVIFVDDGSLDGSVAVLQEAAANDPRVKVLFFSRNFGHQAAITAGIDFAVGDAVVVMDADLQDPPELLPDMVGLVEQGYDVVSAQRVTRSGENGLKKVTATLFYWIMQKLVDSRIRPEVGDFRMFSRRAIIAIRQLGEQHRFMRGMVA